jgi:hypothetical protein
MSHEGQIKCRFWSHLISILLFLSSATIPWEVDRLKHSPTDINCQGHFHTGLNNSLGRRRSLDTILARLGQPRGPQNIEDLKGWLAPVVSALKQSGADHNVVAQDVLVVIRGRRAVGAVEAVDIVACADVSAGWAYAISEGVLRTGIAFVSILVEVALGELEGALVNDLYQ